MADACMRMRMSASANASDVHEYTSTAHLKAQHQVVPDLVVDFLCSLLLEQCTVAPHKLLHKAAPAHSDTASTREHAPRCADVHT